MKQRIPVILDTDIGGDIDDTFALAMLLRCPELDVRLISIVGGDTVYQAKLTAKLLSIAGREDIPIAYDPPKNQDGGPQQDWLSGYALKDFSGHLFEDTTQAIYQTIMKSVGIVKIISIGVATNTASLLGQYPEVADKIEFVGMHGSIYIGYGNSSETSAEANVKYNPQAFRQVLAARMKKTITPLDTCGDIILDGSRYERIKNSQDPLLQAVLANYRIWWKHCDWNQQRQNVELESSVLFDCVAIYLAMSEALLEIEEVPIQVTDDGFTRVDPKGNRARCALRWKDREAFLDLLTERLLAK